MGGAGDEVAGGGGGVPRNRCGAGGGWGELLGAGVLAAGARGGAGDASASGAVAAGEGAGTAGRGTGGAGAATLCFSRSASSRLTSRSCSSVSSIEAPHRQQSAIISQMRTDIGARQSGQAQKIASPSSQILTGALPAVVVAVCPLEPFFAVAPFAAGALTLGNSGSGPVEFKSSTGNTLRGLVGTGGAAAFGSSSGKKSKPISPGAKLCCSSLSCWAWAMPRGLPAGIPAPAGR